MGVVDDGALLVVSVPPRTACKASGEDAGLGGPEGGDAEGNPPSGVTGEEGAGVAGAAGAAGRGGERGVPPVAPTPASAGEGPGGATPPTGCPTEGAEAGRETTRGTVSV